MTLYESRNVCPRVQHSKLRYLKSFSLRLPLCFRKGFPTSIKNPFLNETRRAGVEASKLEVTTLTPRVIWFLEHLSANMIFQNEMKKKFSSRFSSTIIASFSTPFNLNCPFHRTIMFLEVLRFTKMHKTLLPPSASCVSKRQSPSTLIWWLHAMQASEPTENDLSSAIHYVNVGF